MYNALTLAGSPRPHISHSQVSMLDRCQMNWYLKYVMKKPDPQTIYMLCGKAFHYAMECAHREWFKSGGVWPIWPVVRDRCYESFEQGLPKTYLMPRQDVGKLRDSTVSALNVYYNAEIRDKVRPGTSPGAADGGLLVEQTYLVPIFGTDFDFKAIVDLELEDGVLIDYKLSGKKWNQEKIDTGRQQAVAYAFVKDRQVTELRFHLMTRAEQPKFQCVPCVVNRDAVKVYLAHLKKALKLMELLREAIAEPEMCASSCSEYNCGLYTECPKYRNRLSWAS